MSRGSISSWQDYGRRSSQSMPQFSGGPVQFMTSDDIEHKRSDGWFLSYTKIAGIVVVFVIGVVAAGFLGWYVDSLSKKKPYETLDLLNDEIESSNEAGETFTSPFVHPLKYRLELMPIIDDSGPWRIEGRVVIDFHVNDTTGLNKLLLNARNITVASCKLSSVDPGEDETLLRKEWRRRADDNVNYNNYRDDRMLVSGDLYSLENEVTVTLRENKALQYKKDGRDSSRNASSIEGSMVNHDSSSNLANIKAASFKNTSRIPITQYEIDDDREVHTIHLGTSIQRGVYLLEIEYQAPIDENAFFVGNYSASDKEKWLIGTKLRRLGARYLFPVFDDTEHKSIFSVSVAHSEETRVLSNMPLKSSRDASNSSTVVDTFDVSPPLSPYNLAFFMGHIEAIDTITIANSEVVAAFWCESERRSREIYLLDKLSRVIDNLIDIFSMPYPFPKLDLVCLPPGIDESMGSPGLIALKQSLFHSSNSSPLMTKSDALKALINLIAEQWLDVYANANRTDAWLLEGSLIYFQHEITGKIDSSLDSTGSFVGEVILHAMEIDEYSISRPLLENANYRESQRFNDGYAKGACLIRMLHGAISDTAFRNGYRKLITRWKRNATDVADFMNILEIEAAELLLGVSLKEMMNSWTSQGGYPLVTVVRNYDEGSAVIYQEQFVLDRPLDGISKFWYIPLDYTNENSSWSSPKRVWFQSEPKIILENVASNESWVVFNVNKTGYYRVHYDERNWLLLTAALRENHEQFPAETRASLIEDVFSLATVGLMKYETVFDFVKYMQTRERHYLPWSTFMRHMFRLNSLLYETSVFNDFQEFVVRFVSPLYNEEKSRINEGSQLTMIAIKLACVFEHAECLDWSKNVFENSKTDSEIRDAIPSYIRATFYCTVARYGTRREWSYFTERVTSTEDEEEKKRLLSSFACYQAPWVLQSILNEILHEDRFREDEVSVILKAFPKNPAAAQAASRFVRANWQEIAQRYSTSNSVLKAFILSMINGLTTEQDLEDLQIFRENNYDSMKGTRYAAALVEANGNFMTSWLKISLPQIESILKAEAAENPSVL
ncbi:Thyrotropin-releasing hormone-degrading ectoenzyme [Anthophora plagiata]